MSYLYRWKYGDGKVPMKLDVYPIAYGWPGPPTDHRYFYGMRDGVRICFIKRCGENQVRHRIEAEAARISSPYVAALHRDPAIRQGKLEYLDGEIWRELEGETLIYEYFPVNLRTFRQKYIEKRGDIPETYRRQILLKLLQGVAHGHQARIIHRDIKPENILINCFELCEEAPWEHPGELDVKLMDFDAAHDGHYTTSEIFTASEPFQPGQKTAATVWLDLYSVCMVILWLYDGIDGYLYAINHELPKTAERIEAILTAYKAQLPPALGRILLPFLVEAIQKMEAFEPYENEWKDGANWLSALYHGLSSAFREDSDWSPMELLGPEENPQTWSAIVQIDGESWPVLGQGMEYHMISVIDRLPDPDLRGQPFDRQHNGTSVIPFYSGAGVGKPANRDPDGIYSAPPEICLAGEWDNDGWSLKASIFAAPKRAQGSGYERKRLAQKNHIPEDTSVELFNGPPVYVRQNTMAFFKKVGVHSVRFYGETDAPKPLPAFSGRAQDTAANINLVFVMPPPTAPGTDGDLGGRLIRQVVEWISPLEQCCPCYYGVTVMDGLLSGRSFCGGRLNPPPEGLAGQYCASLSSQYKEDRKWLHHSQEDKRYSFDPGLPTIVIGFWDRSLDWSTDPVQHFKHIAKELSPDFKYAVEYLQLFTTEQAKGIQKLAPYLAAAVRTDGACVLTPVSKDGEFPDPGGRWLTAALRWCQR